MKKQLTYSDLLEVLDSNVIRNIKEVCIKVGMSISEFSSMTYPYRNELLQAIEEKKLERKLKLRENWINSGEFIQEKQVYKLIADEEELKLLSNNYVTDSATETVENYTLSLDND